MASFSFHILYVKCLATLKVVTDRILFFSFVFKTSNENCSHKDGFSNSLYQEFEDNSTKFLLVQIERDLMTMFYFSKSSRGVFASQSFDNLNGLPYWTVFISAFE